MHHLLTLSEPEFAALIAAVKDGIDAHGWHLSDAQRALAYTLVEKWELNRRE